MCIHYVIRPSGEGGAMEIGLNLVMIRPESMPEVAAHAEAAGYGSVFVPDPDIFPAQVQSPYPYSPDGSFPFPLDTPLHDPWVVLTSIAAATSTIQLGTAVYVLALRHPFVTARSITSLDVLSGGRVLLGVGAGWLAEEFTAMGLDPRRRFSRVEECIEILRALWTAPPVSHDGLHFQFDAVHFAPRPARVPHPPILLGGDSDAALARAARIADGWMSGGVTSDVGEIERRVGKLRVLREELAPGTPIDVTVLFPRPTADDLARLEAAGVDRVVVIPWDRGRDAIPALQAYAETVVRA
jgi:probable F420-dependent oxidoreductase